MGSLTAAPREAGPTEPVRLRGLDGVTQACTLTAAAHRAVFAQLVLALAQPGEHVHVWPARRRDDGRLAARRRHPSAWTAADDLDELPEVVERWHGRGLEVFAGMLPRRHPQPGRDALAPGAVVWVDADDGSAVTQLDAFCVELPAHYRGASGRGGQHAAWLLAKRHEPAAIASVNRRLAAALGSDTAVCHAGASLRLPGTVNRKPGGGWCRVIAADLALAPWPLAQLVAGLPKDPAAQASLPEVPQTGRPPSRLDPLATIAPPVYFAWLCGVEVPAAGGLVRCPLPDHDDEHPSCMVYATVEQGWRCFSHPGGAGGRIYDLASALAGGPTGSSLRGDAFRDVARELRARLHVP